MLIQLFRTTMGLNWEVRDDVDVIVTERTDDIMDLDVIVLSLPSHPH